MRHGATVESIVTDLFAKFNSNWLRNGKSFRDSKI